MTAIASTYSLRSVGIVEGVHYLQLERDGRILPSSFGLAVEIVRAGGGGRVFIAVHQPEERADGWSPEVESSFRATVVSALETTFRGHGPVEIRYLD